MFQLKFNDDFTTLLRDIPYWKSQEDIPQQVLKFIKDTSSKRVIYEKSTGKYYCSKCIKELENHNYCKNCDIQYKTYTSEDIKKHHLDLQIINEKLSSAIYHFNEMYNYFVFDIKEKSVFLYLIHEEVYYINPQLIDSNTNEIKNIAYYLDPSALIPHKTSKISVDPSISYLIEKNGITKLATNQFISFLELDNYSKKLEEDEWNPEGETHSNMFDIFEELELNYYTASFYTDNLNDLKDTIYQYSKIWELKDYLKEKQNFNISEFTLNPLYYPQFEYLVNYKLYNLAWSVPNWFKKGKNFKEIFGVDKKYLSIMANNNIDCEELKMLQLYPTDDINILKFFSPYSWDIGFCNIVKELNFDLKRLKKYLEDMGLSSRYISDYLDYIHIAKELKLNLKDKNILYPRNFREAHDELYNQIEVIEDPVIDERIKNLSSLLSINKYEDDQYIIYPAASIYDLIEESRQQKNCVRTYCEQVSKNQSQIYFMRKKTEINKSLVTIEVKGTSIIQARVKYNKLPSEELTDILHKWEKSLIPITTE